MAGLVPAIHVLMQRKKKDVDARDIRQRRASRFCPGTTSIVPRIAKAALQDWQDTIAPAAPVQPPLCLPHCGLSPE
jgi:hypothetical protein